jgi:hypothetical protein
LSRKLCFPKLDQTTALSHDATTMKQSFKDKRVPKLELGHED